MEPIDLERERVVDISLESISNQQYYRTLRENTTRPLLVECVQRCGDACAPRPVGHIRRAGRKRLIGVALADCAGYVRQPCAEQKRGHTFARVSYSVQKMQKQTGVLAHRAGNIEQRNNRWLFHPGTEIPQIDQRTTSLHAGAQGAPDIDDVATAVRRKS